MPKGSKLKWCLIFHDYQLLDNFYTVPLLRVAMIGMAKLCVVESGFGFFTHSVEFVA